MSESIHTSLQRFMERIEPLADSGCWIWLAGRGSHGYGIFCVDSKPFLAHRWIYQALTGPVEPGLVLDHFACDERSCVNPTHVRPVTHRENILRGNSVQSWNAAKTHCLRGHPFDEENTKHRPNGKRLCRACQRDHMRRRRAAAKDAA